MLDIKNDEVFEIYVSMLKNILVFKESLKDFITEENSDESLNVIETMKTDIIKYLRDVGFKKELINLLVEKNIFTVDEILDSMI